MASEAMSQLEKSIRHKAMMDATVKFNRDKQALLSQGYTLSSKIFTHEESDQLKALLDKFLKHEVIPKAEEKAVRDFLGSYEQLVQQFPSLVQNEVDGIVHERETQHG